MLDQKCELNVNEIIKKIADYGNTGHVAAQETVDVQTEKLSEGKLMHTNARSGYEEKEEDVPEEVMPAKILTFSKTPCFTTLKAQRIKCQKLELIQTQKGV